MKKNCKALGVLALAVVAAYNVYASHVKSEYSDVVLANVEALAEGEVYPSDCSFYCQPDDRYTCIIKYSGDNVQHTTCLDHRKKAGF